MKRVSTIILVGTTVLLLCSSNCFSGMSKKISETMSSWVGSHKSELIRAWGPPTRIESDGRGGEILVYEYSRDLGQSEGTVYVDNNGNVHYTAPRQRGYAATRMFYVNEDGIIYYWRWQGL